MGTPADCGKAVRDCPLELRWADHAASLLRASYHPSAIIRFEGNDHAWTAVRRCKSGPRVRIKKLVKRVCGGRPYPTQIARIVIVHTFRHYKWNPQVKIDNP